MKLVECVPNFSEGKDIKTINSITDEIKKIKDVTLLDVDMGIDTNRTVVTFVGSPEGVFEAAFNSIKKASELIDMRNHRGEHPRIGATDVCPFVPVSGVTMKDCVRLAESLAKKVGEELKIPAYLYEEAAKSTERKNLANIRAGEYEGLKEKLKDPRWQPDFGTSLFNETSGAIVIGAREFLIAYNVNLNTRDKKLAHEIALNIRESGRPKKDKNGNIIRNKSGKTINVPGKFKNLKAVGWYIDEYKMAQISMNLTNYKTTPIHLAVEEIKKEARKLGLLVTGSELVGLIPKAAMLEAGRYYLKKQNKSCGVPEEELIRVAVESLGLSHLGPFKPEEKIIEYRLEDKMNKLRYMSLKNFINELSSDSPAPGGGSVAALCGALGASLSAMVAGLTSRKKEYSLVFKKMEKIGIQSQELKDKLLVLIDKDAEAFNKVMAAYKLPKKTEEEKKLREKAIEEASKGAAEVPLEVLKSSLEVLNLAEAVAKDGNKNSITDAGVSALMGMASAEAAYYNILINLKTIKDKKLIERLKTEAKKHLSEAKILNEKLKGKILKAVE